MPRVIDGRLATRRIINSSITHPKMADSAIDTAELVDAAVKAAKLAASAVVSGKIADGAVDATAKLADSIVATSKILDGDVTDPKLNSLFQSQNLVSIDSVETYVSFPVAYSDTPVVATAPGPGVTYARVTDVTPGSFAWVGDASGSASWFAHGHR